MFSKLRFLKKINKKRTFYYLSVLLLVIFYSLFNYVFKTPPSSNSTQFYKVLRVIDGDTIELENKQTVRYIGVDAPELHHPKKPVQCFASASAEFNRKLVEGKTVRLEKDVSETDRYKRLLRYIYVINQSTPSAEIFVNKKLVEEGYAYAATFPPDVKYAELFRQAQAEAMDDQRGLWKSCVSTPPTNQSPTRWQ